MINKKVKFDIIKEIVSQADVLIVTAVIEIVFNLFIIANPRVPTPSIGNTIMTGDRIIGSGLMYFLRNQSVGTLSSLNSLIIIRSTM